MKKIFIIIKIIKIIMAAVRFIRSRQKPPSGFTPRHKQQNRTILGRILELIKPRI